MSTLQAIVIAILQGATELFPVSSLGHAVVLPRLLDWPLDQRSPEFLPFLVMLHLGTAVALLLYFWRDWWALATGVLGIGSRHQVGESRRVFLLIVVATIPAVVIGFLLEKFVRGLFGSPPVAAAFLAVNGLLLLFGERLRGRATANRALASLTVTDALTIGLWQCSALIPGISRSGVTMGGGLLAGLSNEDAARYAFLLATPVIGAAGVLKLPELLGSTGDGVRGQALVGAIAAAITTWAAVKFLLRYFETNRLSPFGIYCVCAGVFCLVVFSV